MDVDADADRAAEDVFGRAAAAGICDGGDDREKIRIEAPVTAVEVGEGGVKIAGSACAAGGGGDLERAKRNPIPIPPDLPPPVALLPRVPPPPLVPSPAPLKFGVLGRPPNSVGVFGRPLLPLLPSAAAALSSSL